MPQEHQIRIRSDERDDTDNSQISVKNKLRMFEQNKLPLSDTSPSLDEPTVSVITGLIYFNCMGMLLGA